MATAYERNIVEIREEYTTHLVNLLTPLIYEGVESIYKYAGHIDVRLRDAKKETQGKLKIFQNLLARIPKWNQDLIEKETHRIKQSSRCADWFDDLIKAIVKSNITLLTFTSANRSRLVKERFHEKVNVNDFVHKCYIQCAKGMYNNPYLFWDEDLDPIDIKRNQRDACELIKESIREGIRRMLPVKNILQEYLGTSYTQEEFEDKDFDNTISDAQYRNLKEMVNKDIRVNNAKDNDVTSDEQNVVIQGEPREQKSMPANQEAILKGLLGNDTSPSRDDKSKPRELGAPVFDPPKMPIHSLISGPAPKELSPVSGSPKPLSPLTGGMPKPEISNPPQPPIQTPPPQTPVPAQSQPVTIQTTVQLPNTGGDKPQVTTMQLQSPVTQKVQSVPMQSPVMQSPLFSANPMQSQRLQELGGYPKTEAIGSQQLKPEELKPNLITQSTTSVVNHLGQQMNGGGMQSEDSISFNVKEGEDEYEDVYSNVVHSKKKPKKTSKPGSHSGEDKPKYFANYTKVI